jgi:hypothetical protein
VLVLPADLLESQDVHVGGIQPGVHPVADSSPDPVDIDRGDAEVRHENSLFGGSDIIRVVRLRGVRER